MKSGKCGECGQCNNVSGKTGLLLLLGSVGLVSAAAIATSNMNYQGREYLSGKIVEKTNCYSLNEELKAHESRKKECSYTLKVETKEGDYTIGVLGNKDINSGDKVRFLKQSTRWVTSFNENRKGWLNAEHIEKIVNTDKK